MPQTPAYTTRLRTIIQETGGEQAFANAVGRERSYINRIVNGQRGISGAVLKTISTKLGYSPDWILNGTGKRRKDADAKPTLITEVKDLREEIILLRAEIKRMGTRMQSYEQEIAELKGERV